MLTTEQRTETLMQFMRQASNDREPLASQAALIEAIATTDDTLDQLEASFISSLPVEMDEPQKRKLIRLVIEKRQESI